MVNSETNRPILISLNKKDSGGLGFNIRGGTDSPFANTKGIIVSLIQNEGAAAKDGRLSVGDQILEINGFDLRSVRHRDAVVKFHSADDIVELLVVPGVAKAIFNESLLSDENSPNSSSIGATQVLTSILILGLGLSLAFAYYRYRR